MTYEDAIKQAKDIPMTDTNRLRSFVFSIKDGTTQDQVCAKWFSVASREIKYLKEPVAPSSYRLMVEACAERNNVYLAYAKEPEVRAFIETKVYINSTNCGNYERIKTAIDILHPSEVAARKELIGRLVEFINGTKSETNRPFPGYCFFNYGDITKYGIQPKGTLREMSSGIQRKDIEGS